MKKPTEPLAVVVLAAALSGCPGGPGAAPDGGAEPTLDEEACEHMIEGPASAVTAAADAAGAPDVTEAHTRHDVSLIDVEGGKGGFVRYEASEAGDHVIFLSADVPLEVTDAQGAAIALESDEPFDLCPEVAREKIVELGVGIHTLRFGPTPEGSVSLIVEAGGHEHEE